MLLERWSEWDLFNGQAGGLVMVKRNCPPWSAKVVILSKKDGHYEVSCIIEEQGVPSVCYSTSQQLSWVMSMHHGLDVQEHSEVRGQKQGAD